MMLLKYMHERRKDVHKILKRLIKLEVSELLLSNMMNITEIAMSFIIR